MSKLKTVIVTGGSRGIGAAIAKRLQGFAVVVNYVNSQADAQKVVDDIESSGRQAIALKADVRQSGDFEALFDEAEQQFGGVDALVNNAGVIQPGLVPIAETGDQLLHDLVDINLKGSFYGMRLAANRLRNGGSVVNFSTSLVGLCMPGNAVYAGAKAAIETMTNIFAKELRGKNITVNAVAPGPTATDLFLTDKPEAVVEQATKAPPLERLGTADDIAGVVEFLVSEQGRWINGQTIRANGGLI